MDNSVLIRHFARMGARLEILPDPQMWSAFSLNIAGTRKAEEHFLLRYQPQLVDHLRLQVVNLRPDLRHLLLLTEGPAARGGGYAKQKFLCGHDERHWFSAVVRQGHDVRTALESLKPAGLAAAQDLLGVRSKARNRRKNAAFLRQGEWFFLPRPEFIPETNSFILKQEPLRRGLGKPHYAGELVRTRGQTVYFLRGGHRVWTQPEFEQYIREHPHKKHLPWQTASRNMRVYVRGTVRHPDHATLHLPFWHAVQLSNEAGSANLAFLD